MQAKASRRRYCPILPKPGPVYPQPSSSTYHLKAESNPVATVQLHPAPVKIEDSAFFMPGPEAISVTSNANCPVHGDGTQAQAPIATQETENALVNTGKSKEQQEIEKIKYEVEKNLVQMARMSKQNEELLKIFLCKEEMEREATKLKELGVLKESPWMGRKFPVETRAVNGHHVLQDPAVIDATIQVPSPSSSVSSSVPSLENPFQGLVEDSDSDCVITGYTPPKKRNVVVKTEPSDSVSQLAKGTQNLLL